MKKKEPTQFKLNKHGFHVDLRNKLSFPQLFSILFLAAAVIVALVFATAFYLKGYSVLLLLGLLGLKKGKIIFEKTDKNNSP